MIILCTAMLSGFMCCEIFKALIIITCKFLYVHAFTLMIISVAIFLLFVYNVTFRRTVWFFYQQAMAIGMVSAWCTLILPVFWFRQHKFNNALTLSSIAKPLVRIIGIEYEIRNKDRAKLMEGESAVVVSNHPSGLDILSMMYLVNETKQAGTMIISHNFRWFGPFGWVLEQCGFGFIKKTPGLRETYEKINQLADAVCEQKMKIWIFPEGRTSEKILPFKKGAFRIAIDRKIPIIPVVFSPHNFIDWNNLQAERGKIIIDILSPIPTVELSLKNMEFLMAKTYLLISERYDELGEEIRHKIP